MLYGTFSISLKERQKNMRVEGETHNILNSLKNSKGSWRFRTFSRSFHNKSNIFPSLYEAGKSKIRNTKENKKNADNRHQQKLKVIKSMVGCDEDLDMVTIAA